MISLMRLSPEKMAVLGGFPAPDDSMEFARGAQLWMRVRVAGRFFQIDHDRSGGCPAPDGSRYLNLVLLTGNFVAFQAISVLHSVLLGNENIRHTCV